METETKAVGDGKVVEMSKGGRKIRRCELVLRFLGLALTLVAAIILGVDKETKVVPITITSTLPPIDVPVTAKWHHMSAFVYFVVANAIACTHAALSLILCLVSKNGQKGMKLVIIFLDLMMVALLFSGNGAAAAIGVIGYNGNSHVRWNKVCNVFTKFCNHVAVSIVLSLLGSLSFLLVILLIALSLPKHK
ncbi:Casparian strip membrane protein domain [Dillenia turbinata]|uniref:CASP-like protein n=1 Tax=Dillenia turbinata TaxID=194707 RepID=A0AAN8UE54_9MAGN